MFVLLLVLQDLLLVLLQVLVAAQIRTVVGLVDVVAVLVVVGQALAEEVLAPVGYLWLRWEEDLPRVEYCLVLQYGLLALVVSEGLCAVE